MEYKTTQTEAQTMMDAGVALAASPKYAANDGVPYIVLPDGYKTVDLEKLLPSPVRKRGTVTVNDTRSFNDYVLRHGTEQGCVIYADLNAEESRLKMVAVLNDHRRDESDADWQDHRCVFSPKQSVEWKRWLLKDKSIMSQSDFATWLEDNLGDIESAEGMPTGAMMLQMALMFEANSEKRLRSKINLQTGGVRFEFVDDADKDTRTSMEVFQRFTIGVPVFEGSGSRYPVEARLKYREKEGKVNFWYELIRPDLVFKTAALEEVGIVGAATGFLIINGTI